MKKLYKNMLVAFAMYSRLPVPKADWEDETMKYSICFFPLIGAVIGLLEVLLRLALLRTGAQPALQGAALAVLPVLLTGGIHMDGFLDTSDAVGSWKSMEEKLEIMKDSHAGASAVICGLCYMVLYAGILAQGSAKALQLIGVGFVLSRAWSGFGLVALRKAKKTGLLRTFSDRSDVQRCKGILLLWIGAASGLLAVFGGTAGVVCAACAGAVFVWYRWMAYTKFGGITGDLAGYFLQLCELAVAFAAVMLCP